MKGTLAVSGIPEADDILNTDPLALLLGMLLDQQVRVARISSRTRRGGLDRRRPCGPR